MRSKLIHSSIAFALIIAGVISSGCKGHDRVSGGSYIDLRLTEAGSPGEIERMFRGGLAGRDENTTSGLSIYQISTSSSHFVFVQAFNYPRGLLAFSLYCYEQAGPQRWHLRSVVPINEYYFTNDATRTVRFDVDGENVSALYRGMTVFTVTGTRTNGKAEQNIDGLTPPP